MPGNNRRIVHTGDFHSAIAEAICWRLTPAREIIDAAYSDRSRLVRPAAPSTHNNRSQWSLLFWTLIAGFIIISNSSLLCVLFQYVATTKIYNIKFFSGWSCVISGIPVRRAKLTLSSFRPFILARQTRCCTVSHFAYLVSFRWFIASPCSGWIKFEMGLAWSNHVLRTVFVAETRSRPVAGACMNLLGYAVSIVFINIHLNNLIILLTSGLIWKLQEKSMSICYVHSM